MIRSDQRRGSRVALLVVLLLASVAARRARAGEDNETAARALFLEGRRLAAADDYSSACVKFEASYKLDPGIGTNFNLADCEEHLGRTASAWMRFLNVAASTKAAGQPERERVARARAAALEPRLSRIVVTMPSPPPGVVVQRDGEIVPSTMWGVATPLDPGRHTFEAVAPGKLKWSSKIDVAPGPEVVNVLVPALEDEPLVGSPARAVPATAVVGASTSAPPRPPVEVPRLSWWVGGVGAIVTVSGAVFAVKSSVENSQAKARCHTNGVDGSCADSNELAEVNSLRTSARRDEEIAILAASAGAAMVVTAGVWWWWTTHHAHQARSARAPMIFAASATDLGIGVAW